MKRNRFSLLRIALILLVLASVATFVFRFVLPSRAAWRYASILSNALQNARSVTLVEFQRDIVGPELVLSRIPASPEQIAELRAATGAWFAPIPPWRMKCFDPHHRVEIIRADGSTLRFDICFHCQNFTLGEPHAVTMPDSWHDRLSRFFTSVGMPPRDDYSALAKNHPDYHSVEEARRKLEEQAQHLNNAPHK